MDFRKTLSTCSYSLKIYILSFGGWADEDSTQKGRRYQFQALYWDQAIWILPAFLLPSRFSHLSRRTHQNQRRPDPKFVPLEVSSPVPFFFYEPFVPSVSLLYMYIYSVHLKTKDWAQY